MAFVSCASALMQSRGYARTRIMLSCSLEPQHVLFSDIDVLDVTDACLEADAVHSAGQSQDTRWQGCGPRRKHLHARNIVY